MAILFLVLLSLTLVAVIGVAFILVLQRVIDWVVDRVEARGAAAVAATRDDFRPAA